VCGQPPGDRGMGSRGGLLEGWSRMAHVLRGNKPAKQEKG
jgi:hypothetical protein